jgi:hypothetical protein
MIWCSGKKACLGTRLSMNEDKCKSLCRHVLGKCWMQRNWNHESIAKSTWHDNARFSPLVLQWFYFWLFFLPQPLHSISLPTKSELASAPASVLNLFLLIYFFCFFHFHLHLISVKDFYCFPSQFLGYSLINSSCFCFNILATWDYWCMWFFFCVVSWFCGLMDKDKVGRQTVA